MKTKRLLAPCCLLAALAGTPAGAAVLFETSDPAPSPSSGVYNGYATENTVYGFVFTTDSGTSITIESVSVLLRSRTSTPIASANVTVELFQASRPPSILGLPSGSAIATKQATLNLPGEQGISSPSGDAQSINTGGGSAWTLQASTQYFLAVSTTTSNVNWVTAATSSAGSAPAGSGITYNGHSLIINGNSYPFLQNEPVWIIVSDTAAGGGGSSSVPDAGPGPALAVLLGGLGLRQWRRTRRTGAAA